MGLLIVPFQLPGLGCLLPMQSEPSFLECGAGLWTAIAVQPFNFRRPEAGSHLRLGSFSPTIYSMYRCYVTEARSLGNRWAARPRILTHYFTVRLLAGTPEVLESHPVPLVLLRITEYSDST